MDAQTVAELLQRIELAFPSPCGPPPMSLRGGNAVDDYDLPPAFDPAIDVPNAGADIRAVTVDAGPVDECPDVTCVTQSQQPRDDARRVGVRSSSQGSVPIGRSEAGQWSYWDEHS
jgi:hypothetical protein